MTDITITTIQNVAINFKPASLGERIVAFMINELVSKIEEVTTIKNHQLTSHQFIQTIINDFNHLTSK